MQPSSPGLQGCAYWLARLLPFTTTASALLAGLLIGGMTGVRWSQAPPVVTYVEATSLAGLEEQCAPVRAEIGTQRALLSESRDRLADALAARERQIGVLEPLAAAQGTAPIAADGRNYKGELLEVTVQRTELRADLRVVEGILAGLSEQAARIDERLVTADPDLAGALSISDLLRGPDGTLGELELLSGWQRFLRESQARACVSASVRDERDCRAALLRALASLKAEFVRCWRAGTPMGPLVPASQAPPGPVHALRANEATARWVVSACP